jgi:hypothetical protein
MHAAQALAGDTERLPARVLALVGRARQSVRAPRQLTTGEVTSRQEEQRWP